MKHYVCEVIRISATSADLASLIVSVLVTTGEMCATLLPIVLQPYSAKMSLQVFSNVWRWSTAPSATFVPNSTKAKLEQGRGDGQTLLDPTPNVGIQALVQGMVKVIGLNQINHTVK